MLVGDPNEGIISTFPHESSFFWIPVPPGSTSHAAQNIIFKLPWSLSWCLQQPTLVSLVHFYYRAFLVPTVPTHRHPQGLTVPGLSFCNFFGFSQLCLLLNEGGKGKRCPWSHGLFTTDHISSQPRLQSCVLHKRWYCFHVPLDFFSAYLSQSKQVRSI